MSTFSSANDTTPHNRVLWVGDAGVHSGFGTVTHNIAERLVTEHGYDIRVLAANYRGDHFDTPLALYPASLKEPKDVYGDSRIIEMLGTFLPDAVVFLNDPAVVLNTLLKNPWDPEQVLWRGYQNGEAIYKPPLLAYLPVDGRNTPRSWDTLTERVTRIAMSEFGRMAMPEASVVWHGVDTKVFYPRDKREAKRALGLDPDRFLVLRVDRNSLRKDFAATWAALRPLLRKFTDIDVIFHTQENSYEGVNLLAYRWNDEDIRDRVGFPQIGGFLGWDLEHLSLLYSAADLFVTTSHGEGFGLTILESLACGTPAVATDCSSITEVVGPGGALVPPAGWTAVPMGQEQALPDIAGFTNAIERLYQGAGSRRKLAEKGIAHAQKFSWEFAAKRFDMLIREAITPPTVNRTVA